MIDRILGGVAYPRALRRAVVRFRGPPRLRWEDRSARRSHLCGPEHREAFQAFGCSPGAGRGFFPHRVRFIPKAAPDALRRARRVVAGVRSPRALWTVTVHVEPPTRDEFPAALFFDDDLVWHRQQLGRPGHVAFGSAAVRGRELVVLAMQSDVAQRSSRVPEHRSRIRNRFGGWPNVTLHAMAHLGVRLGLDTLRSPRADTILARTDPERDPDRALFDRTYDRTLARDFGAVRDGDDWRLDLRDLGPRLVALEEDTEPIGETGPVACIMHDIERGLGHADRSLARRVEARGWAPLEAMVEVEAAAGVPATYCVTGTLWQRAAERIPDGHELAFHSYDHGPGPQLLRCREVDYRARGYRPPQSRIRWEHGAAGLVGRNFEWLASAASSLGCTAPELRRRVARIPVALDDYPLHTGALRYDDWEAELLELVESRPFVAVGLHDCYGDLWLDRYPALLARLGGRARLARAGDVSDELFLAAAL